MILSLFQKFRTRLAPPPLLIQHIGENPINPYYTVVPEGLRPLGWEVVYEGDPDKVLERLTQNKNRPVIIHLHQLDVYYSIGGAANEEAKARATHLLGQIHQYRSLGAKLVWTRHNPHPHNQAFSDIDTYVVKHLLPLVDTIIFLGEKARQDFSTRHPHPNEVIVHHPALPDPAFTVHKRETTRTTLGIPDEAFVFSVLGELRANKHIELTAKAFSLLPSTPEKRLLISGSIQADYRERLRECLPDQTIFRPHPLTHEDYLHSLAATDCSVFAFTSLYASSSVIYSLSHGIPVLAPDIGALSEYLKPAWGQLFSDSSPEQMRNAMVEIMTSAPFSPQRDIADSFTQAFPRRTCVKKHLRLYREIIS